MINGPSIKITNNFASATITFNPLVSTYGLNGYDFIKRGQEFEYDIANMTNSNPNTSSTYWYINSTNNLSVGSGGNGVGTTYPVVYVTLIDSNRIKIKVGPQAQISDKITLTYNNGSDINITKTIQVISPIS